MRRRQRRVHRLALGRGPPRRSTGAPSVYVQASRHEGFGLAVAEAMLAGCVPVVMNVTAMPEVVGDAGVLIDSQDPEAVAAAVRRALELGPDAGRRARERILDRVPDGEPARRAPRGSRSDPRRIVPPAARRRAAAMENSRSDPLRAPRRAPRGGRVTRSCSSSARSSTSSTARGSARPISFSRRRSRSTRSRPGWLRARRLAASAPTASRDRAAPARVPRVRRDARPGRPRAFRERRTPLIALAAVVALLGAAAAGFAVSELTATTAAPPPAASAKPVGGRGGEADSPSGGVAGPAESGDGSRSRWPRGPRA